MLRKIFFYQSKKFTCNRQINVQSYFTILLFFLTIAKKVKNRNYSIATVSNRVNLCEIKYNNVGFINKKSRK